MLITGGEGKGALQSAEIYLPDKETPCVLPDIPDLRYKHSQDGSLVCGGWRSRRSCRKWNPDTGAWNLMNNSLPEERGYHISWTLADGSVTYLMGGDRSGNTTEVIEHKNCGVRASFPLKYRTE